MFSKQTIAKAAAILAAVIFVLPACSVFGRQSRTPMSIKIISGSATIHRGSVATNVRKQAKLQIGDRIELSNRGVSQISLEPGRLFELVGGQATVKRGDRLQLDSGRLLAAVTAPARVSVGALRIDSTVGTFRVDRNLSTRTGVYKGRAFLQLGADRLALPRLRQAVVAEGVLPQKEKPLRINSQDRWDKRFLQPVLDLDDRLENFGRGLEAQLGPGTGVDFFSRVVPGAGDLSFLNQYSNSRRSDILIGLSLSSEAVGRDISELSPTFQKTFGLWSEGASWGLVAYEFSVGQTNLFNRLLQAVGLSGILVGGRGAGLFASLRPAGASAVNGAQNGNSFGGSGGANDFSTTGGAPPPPPPTNNPLPGPVQPPGGNPIPPGTVPPSVQDVVDQILNAGGQGTGQDPTPAGNSLDPLAATVDQTVSSVPLP